jgi:uncharacterized repeat protein (TIGR01451 family)
MRKFYIILFIVFAIKSNAQIINFSDNNLKQALLAHEVLLDLNGDSEISYSEAEAFEGTLNLTGKGISSCNELNYFTHVLKIDISGNLLSTLELTNLEALENLNCENNILEFIRIEDCESIDSLNLRFNKFTDFESLQAENVKYLDVRFNDFASYTLSGFPELKELLIQQFEGDERLEYLNLKQLVNLENLSCFGDIATIDLGTNYYLSQLNFSCNLDTLLLPEDTPLLYLTSIRAPFNNLSTLGNISVPNLHELFIGGNPIQELPISHCHNLQNLSANNGLIESIDLSECFNLRSLDLSMNQLSEIDLSNCPHLHTVRISDNLLNNLNISKNTQITHLNCSDNQLNSINLSKQKQLSELLCSNNQLTSLDITNKQHLYFIRCNSNQLSEINFDGCPKLEQIYAGTNNIEQISMGQHKLLKHLSVERNPLYEISFSENQSIESLILDWTELSTLDLHNLHGLKSFRINNCENLKHINLKNGNNYNFDAYAYSFTNNDNLESFCLDNVESQLMLDFQELTIQELTFTDDCEGEGLGYNLLDISCTFGEYSDIYGVLFSIQDKSTGEKNIYVNKEYNAPKKVQQGTFVTSLETELYDHLYALPKLDANHYDLNENQFQENQLYINRFDVNTKDLGIQIMKVEEPQPGQDFKIIVYIDNLGTTCYDSDFRLGFDPEKISFKEMQNSSNHLIFDKEDHIDVYNRFASTPMHREIFEFTFYVNEAVAVNDSIKISAHLMDFIDDVEENNIDILYSSVKEGIMFNYIELSEQDNLQLTATDSSLHYTINFTNTSNEVIENLTIYNTLPEKLRFESYRFISSSHYCNIQVEDDNNFVYEFPDINLLPYSNNPEDAQLRISYSIKPENTINSIHDYSNSAQAYIDEAFLWNIETLEPDLTIIPESKTNSCLVFLYPNPATSNVKISSIEKIKSVTLFSASGIFIKKYSNNTLLDISNLEAGIYVVQVILDNGKIVNKKLTID